MFTIYCWPFFCKQPMQFPPRKSMERSVPGRHIKRFNKQVDLTLFLWCPIVNYFSSQMVVRFHALLRKFGAQFIFYGTWVMRLLARIPMWRCRRAHLLIWYVRNHHHHPSTSTATKVTSFPAFKRVELEKAAILYDLYASNKDHHASSGIIRPNYGGQNCRLDAKTLRPKTGNLSEWTL